VKLALAGALSGFLLILSFPRFPISPAPWVALVPLLTALSHATPRQGLIGGAVMGLVGHTGLVYWTNDAAILYGGVSRLTGVAALMTLVAYMTLFTMAFGGLVVLTRRFVGILSVAVIPFLWVGLEALRFFPWGGLPWCLLGYSQAGVLPVIQLASLTGIHGVSLLVVFVNAAMAYCLAGPGVKKAAVVCAPVLAVVVAVLGFGFTELSRPDPEASFPVAAVQGNVGQERKWDAEYADAIFSDYLRLSETAARHGARLIVWPESATPFHFDGTPELAGRMKSFAEASDVYLLFGSDDYDSDEAFNGAKLITPEGEVSLRYHKNILVPFAEYVPLRRLFFFAENLMEDGSDFSPGRGVQSAPVDEGTIGAFICYETIFPGLVRRFVQDGAGLLVNLTNDAWFDRSSAPHQHFGMAVVRAVENRRYLVRAANTGISAVIDPYGRVLKRSGLFEQTVVTGKIAFRDDETLYVRYGDVVGLTAAVVTVLFGAMMLVLRKKT
jgi:apolipoprotein N-acyltransferase